MMSWLSLSRFLDGLRGVYQDINPSTLTGAIDVIVVEQPDGSFIGGPFHVRFGKLTAIAPADKVVEIYVNGEYVDFLRMQLGGAGDAYFVDADSPIIESSFGRPSTSPIRMPNRRRRRRVRRDTAQSEPDSHYSEDDLDVDEFCPKSDGEQTQFHRQSNSTDHLTLEDHRSLSSSTVDLEWTWGSFPHRKTSRSSHSTSHRVVMKTETPAIAHDAEQQQTTDAIEAVKSTTKSDCVYLDDLVTSEVDPTFKESYIYVPPHSKSSFNQIENGGANYDAGYRSDGEHSPRSLSPIQSSTLSGLRLSLCGCPPIDTPLSEEKFSDHLITYEEFIQSPDAVLNNPNLTIQWNGKFLTWQVAAPALLSLLAFQTALPHRTLRRLEETYMPRKEISRGYWFTWRSRQPKDLENMEGTSGKPITQPLPLLAEQEFSVDLPVVQPNSTSRPPSPKCDMGDKVNRLSSEQIKQLNFRPGRNDIEFRVTTKLQGTCTCSASIFVWHWADRLVISDVDGTITRSDVLGHVMPILGHDWTHTGVTHLYTQIARNGYRFVYVSTRPVGHAGKTRNYLRHVQDSSEMLPEGPILLSPNSLLHTLHQEVIEKTPEIFKIKCLLDVRSLFPMDNEMCSPLYAGFGNKTNDVFAYQKAGLPPHRIFTVNSRSEVKNESQTTKTTSFPELSGLVDMYFPLLRHQVPTITVGAVESPPSQPDESRTHIETTEQIISTHLTQSFSCDYPLPPDLIDTSKYSCFTFWRDPTTTATTTTTTTTSKELPPKPVDSPNVPLP